jgi:hypothetical protein
MSKLAQLIASEEGFFKSGSLPQRQCNPGDLEHAPGESHQGTGPVGSFATPALGWTALENQLQLDASRGWTLQQMVYTYAPPPQNNSAQYLAYLVQGLGCAADTPMAQALLIT